MSPSPARHLAVFVDGCFWHSCPQHGSQPKSNRGYWDSKLADNRARDLRQTEALRIAGWTVVRLWEHEGRTGFAESIETILQHFKRTNS